MAPCPFCDIEPRRPILSNDLAFAVRDAFPVSEGHTLIIPRRHIANWWETNFDEQAAMLELLEEAKAALDEELHPDGYNVGMNDGAAAGQTVFHLHIHLIPRFDGDVEDPRGGVRHVVPERAQDMVGESPVEARVKRLGLFDERQRDAVERVLGSIMTC